MTGTPPRHCRGGVLSSFEDSSHRSLRRAAAASRTGRRSMAKSSGAFPAVSTLKDTMSIVTQPSVLPAAAGLRPGHGLRRRPAFRADIQALRALAVALVVLNHLWPTRLTGGYVGVDVFFVISGFLITSHLLKERISTGRIRLAAFYARRIRRLLPAAFLVLAVSLAAT